MSEAVKILPNYRKFSEYIKDVENFTSPMMLSGLTDSGKVHFAYSTFFYTERPICIITYNEIQAKKIIKDLQYFEKNIEYFPKREILAYDYLAESKDILYKRISCLNNIHEKKAKIIVTTVEAVMQKIVPQEILYKNIITIKIGNNIDLEEIKQKLVALGYNRCDAVESKSQFSIRGGIIDIAVTDKKGIRIELWGNEVDSIRSFNLETQRSIDKKERIKIFPAHEFIVEKNFKEVAKKINNEEDKKEIQARKLYK